MKAVKGGIGCTSIDVATDPQDPYLRLAHDLGRRGVVVMRLEKSGVGDSQGPSCATTDFAAETRSDVAAFDALRQDPDVDPWRVDATLAEKERCMHGLLIDRRDEADRERAEPDGKVHDAYPVAAPTCGRSQR